MTSYIFFFFFQAEDGIRDYKVTGVQTCALPIWCSIIPERQCATGTYRCIYRCIRNGGAIGHSDKDWPRASGKQNARSEERRVGEEGRCRWWPYPLKKKKKK